MGSSRGGSLRVLVSMVALLVAGVTGALYFGLEIEPDAGDAAGDAAVSPTVVAASAVAATAPTAKKPTAAVASTDAVVRGSVRLYRSKQVVGGFTLTLKQPEGVSLSATTEADGTFRFEHL